MKTIKISKDFSDNPIGRYKDDSNYSGERFREEFLIPALRSKETVIVDIDDVQGYSSSFLEEAFGGLVSKGHFTKAELSCNLKIIYKDTVYKMYSDLIWKYINGEYCILCGSPYIYSNGMCNACFCR